jgi:predicted branched-subunit amino acid permease
LERTWRPGGGLVSTISPHFRLADAKPSLETGLTVGVMRSVLDKTAPAYALALRDTASVALGIAAFGVTLGVTISVLGFGTLPGLVGAPVVYGGSAQLTAVTLVHQGAAFAAVVASAAIVNSRLLLYSASLSRRFGGQPAWFRWLAPHFIIDQTYLLSNARPELDGRAFRRYWGWLGFLVCVVWSSSVLVGMLAGPALPDLPHLVFVGTAMFLGMLTPRLTNCPAVAAATTGGVVAAVVGLIRPELGILCGAIAGIMAGSAVRR